ncbi:conserved hypothetical protein [Vibrio chagasii]|uniref:hypothetical protein n=1 Tax=Vibrio coralliirubri TaxID=1516159 RepID=UPI00063A5633|nr:hypothetical protein [Vibrio coralliirubri]CAH6803155.1 conserved hypothetical protein [Vibrio chagasii]CAH6840428.1 conserved hypothetical protein [Vibrio chagasii]CAH6842337.1 conserved hypothetical protein [Vibrio chagasii]CAH7063665.1 conserved hypothetical protein [Vibrio chagasii]CAH7097974.1 conserved hypothetical protein [Vibrio chagasii]
MSKSVIVVRANESLDKKVISQMVSQGFAPGFKASLDRVNDEINFIIITNTDNDRAVLGRFTHAVEHETTKQTEQNLDGRIDIYFTDSCEVEPKQLYENVEFNNSNPVRYISKYW